MSILDIKKKIGYVDRTIPIIIPQHDDDVCYVVWLSLPSYKL